MTTADPMPTSSWARTLWLVLGGTSAVTAVIFLSMLSHQAKLHPKKTAVEQAEQPNAHVTVEKVAATNDVGAFTKEVPAIALTKSTASVAIGSHEPEFRGSKFIEDNKNKWTLQIFQVRDEDIISSYLDKRDDRKQFNYLRLNDSKNPEQFVLLYGTYPDAQTALQQASRLNFGLPNSIKVTAQKISSYRALVNDLGSDEANSALTLRTVVLNKVAIPKPRPTTVELSNLNPTQIEQLGGTTTVVRTRPAPSHSTTNINSTSMNNNNVNNSTMNNNNHSNPKDDETSDRPHKAKPQLQTQNQPKPAGNEMPSVNKPEHSSNTVEESVKKEPPAKEPKPADPVVADPF